MGVERHLGSEHGNATITYTVNFSITGQDGTLYKDPKLPDTLKDRLMDATRAEQAQVFQDVEKQWYAGLEGAMGEIGLGALSLNQPDATHASCYLKDGNWLNSEPTSISARSFASPSKVDITTTLKRKKSWRGGIPTEVDLKMESLHWPEDVYKTLGAAILEYCPDRTPPPEEKKPEVTVKPVEEVSAQEPEA